MSWLYERLSCARRAGLMSWLSSHLNGVILQTFTKLLIDRSSCARRALVEPASSCKRGITDSKIQVPELMVRTICSKQDDHCLTTITVTVITRTKVIWQKVESLWNVQPTPHFYSPGGSMGLTVWLQYATACLGWRFNPNRINVTKKTHRLNSAQCVPGYGRMPCIFRQTLHEVVLYTAHSVQCTLPACWNY